MNDLQTEIAEQFRKAELERREARRKIILAHARLEGDEAPDEIEKAALDRIRRQNEDFLRLTQVGYWRTLWLAVTGKLHRREE